MQCSDNFTFLYIAHSLGSLTYDDMRGIPEAIEVRSEIVAAGVVIPLINKLQRTKDSDMRYLGALLLANLACDIDHNEALMAAGVVPVLLKCILASPKDQRVQSNCITVLFNLSVRRPDCVKEMKKSGAQQVLQQVRGAHLGILTFWCCVFLPFLFALLSFLYLLSFVLPFVFLMLFVAL